MKINLLLPLLICIASGCQDTIDVGAPCVQERIDEFKNREYADKIFRIDRPGDPLYWFVDEILDGGEEIVTENCEIFCVTDFYGTTNIWCDQSLFSIPRTLIWEK